MAWRIVRNMFGSVLLLGGLFGCTAGGFLGMTALVALGEQDDGAGALLVIGAAIVALALVVMVVGGKLLAVGLPPPPRERRDEGGALGALLAIIALSVGTTFAWGIGALIGLYHGKRIERAEIQRTPA